MRQRAGLSTVFFAQPQPGRSRRPASMWGCYLRAFAVSSAANSSSGRSIQAQHSTQSGHVVNGVIYRRRARKFLKSRCYGTSARGRCRRRGQRRRLCQTTAMWLLTMRSASRRGIASCTAVSVYDLWYRAAFVPSTKTSTTCVLSAGRGSCTSSNVPAERVPARPCRATPILVPDGSVGAARKDVYQTIT